MADLEKTGVDLTEARNLVADAKTALDADDLKEVNMNMVKAEDMINDARDQYLSDELKGNIDEIEKNIANAKELGTDTETAQSNLVQAQKLIGQGKFGEAKSFIGKARASLDETKEDYYQK